MPDIYFKIKLKFLETYGKMDEKNGHKSFERYGNFENLRGVNGRFFT